MALQIHPDNVDILDWSTINNQMDIWSSNIGLYLQKFDGSFNTNDRNLDSIDSSTVTTSSNSNYLKNASVSDVYSHSLALFAYVANISQETFPLFSYNYTEYSLDENLEIEWIQKKMGGSTNSSYIPFGQNVDIYRCFVRSVASFSNLNGFVPYSDLIDGQGVESFFETSAAPQCRFEFSDNCQMRIQSLGMQLNLFQSLTQCSFQDTPILDLDFSFQSQMVENESVATELFSSSSAFSVFKDPQYQFYDNYGNSLIFLDTNPLLPMNMIGAKGIFYASHRESSGGWADFSSLIDKKAYCESPTSNFIPNVETFTVKFHGFPFDEQTVSTTTPGVLSSHIDSRHPVQTSQTRKTSKTSKANPQTNIQSNILSTCIPGEYNAPPCTTCSVGFYCPGDDLRYPCDNKPTESIYYSLGNIDPICPFQCTDEYSYQGSNTTCTPPPIGYFSPTGKTDISKCSIQYAHPFSVFSGPAINRSATGCPEKSYFTGIILDTLISETYKIPQLPSIPKKSIRIDGNSTLFAPSCSISDIEGKTPTRSPDQDWYNKKYDLSNADWFSIKVDFDLSTGFWNSNIEQTEDCLIQGNSPRGLPIGGVGIEILGLIGQWHFYIHLGPNCQKSSSPSSNQCATAVNALVPARLVMEFDQQYTLWNEYPAQSHIFYLNLSNPISLHVQTSNHKIVFFVDNQFVGSWQWLNTRLLPLGGYYSKMNTTCPFRIFDSMNPSYNSTSSSQYSPYYSNSNTIGSVLQQIFSNPVEPVKHSYYPFSIGGYELNTTIFRHPLVVGGYNIELGDSFAYNPQVFRQFSGRLSRLKFSKGVGTAPLFFLTTPVSTRNTATLNTTFWKQYIDKTDIKNTTKIYSNSIATLLDKYFIETKEPAFYLGTMSGNLSSGSSSEMMSSISGNLSSSDISIRNSIQLSSSIYSHLDSIYNSLKTLNSSFTFSHPLKDLSYLNQNFTQFKMYALNLTTNHWVSPIVDRALVDILYLFDGQSASSFSTSNIDFTQKLGLEMYFDLSMQWISSWRRIGSEKSTSFDMLYNLSDPVVSLDSFYHSQVESSIQVPPFQNYSFQQLCLQNGVVLSRSPLFHPGPYSDFMTNCFCPDGYFKVFNGDFGAKYVIFEFSSSFQSTLQLSSLVIIDGQNMKMSPINCFGSSGTSCLDLFQSSQSSQTSQFSQPFNSISSSWIVVEFSSIDSIATISLTSVMDSTFDNVSVYISSIPTPNGYAGHNPHQFWEHNIVSNLPIMQLNTSLFPPQKDFGMLSLGTGFYTNPFGESNNHFVLYISSRDFPHINSFLTKCVQCPNSLFSKKHATSLFDCTCQNSWELNNVLNPECLSQPPQFVPISVQPINPLAFYPLSMDIVAVQSSDTCVGTVQIPGSFPSRKVFSNTTHFSLSIPSQSENSTVTLSIVQYPSSITSIQNLAIKVKQRVPPPFLIPSFSVLTSSPGPWTITFPNSTEYAIYFTLNGENPLNTEYFLGFPLESHSLTNISSHAILYKSPFTVSSLANLQAVIVKPNTPPSVIVEWNFPRILKTSHPDSYYKSFWGEIGLDDVCGTSETASLNCLTCIYFFLVLIVIGIGTTHSYISEKLNSRAYQRLRPSQ